jgi:ubiquinone/menaquinone biosynthesis C-methylase UbiE
MRYIHHFGEKSSEYLQYRPTYPDQLFQYLYGMTEEANLVWDCGTGNGQSAIALSHYFKKVIASDINQPQLDQAIKKDNIHYCCFSAENAALSDSIVDMITVAQALHWLDLEIFYQEVKRVSHQTSFIAAWCYSLGTFQKEVDEIIQKLYADILGDQYWPKERQYIDKKYQTIYFPFQRIQTPTFMMTKHVNLMELIGYLNTWSAIKEYQRLNHSNPIHLVMDDLKESWGDPIKKQEIGWPIHLLLGRVF